MYLVIGSILILIGIILLALKYEKASLVILIFGVLIESYGIVLSLTGR